MKEERFESLVDLYVQAVPFQPFTIVMASGNRYEVDHRRAFENFEGTGLFVNPGGASVFFDHETVSEIIGDLNLPKDEFKL